MAAKARAANVPIIGDVELFVSTYPDAKYIGVTGTNGKSTATALIWHILRRAGLKAEIGGNFGVPVFDMPPLGADGFYVVELSSYQLELAPSLDLDFAGLLNITPDHLARHNGMDGYVAAKKLIFRHDGKKSAVNVVAIDDPYTKKIFKELGAAEPRRAKNIPVSFNRKTDGYYVSRGTLVDNTRGDPAEVMDLKSLPNLTGRHNWQNVALSYAICRAAGVSKAQIVEGIKSFEGLPHRIQRIGDVCGVSFINDSKATNAESVKYAIESMDDIYWIVGGRQKEGGIEILKPMFQNGNIRRVYAIGECEKQFYRDTKDALASYRCGRLEKAVAKAFKHALKDLRKGRAKSPVILLSPAAASWDQYESYEKRGEHFIRLYGELKKKYGA
jgi:UDP-N-acetylmuramoylalanine--D-glutamate ligase